jgi:glutathione gamma-glutamylcysteinyltransferase
MLLEALTQNSAAAYIPLTEHFCNQSDPAFCGITTLLMVLNAFAVDPMVRWKGGWRYFGDETVLLSQCCLSAEYIRRVGVTMEQLQQLAVCHGLRVQMERPHNNENEFRTHVREYLQQTENPSGMVVVSYARSALGQTGEGHFSPLAAYHEASDQVLLLDVARFKYPPYWVPVAELYQAMTFIDPVTAQPRGWYVLRPPLISHSYKGVPIVSEERRPASWVPVAGQSVSLCPLHPVKIDFCQAIRPRNARRPQVLVKEC